MSGLQVAMMAGALVGVGLALLVWRLVPADPDLAETLERLSPERIRRRRAAQVVRHTGRQERLGVWAEGSLPSQVWVGAPPNEDLAILGVTRARFLGEKIVGAVIGLATPPLAVLLLTVVQGHAPSVALAALGSLALAAAGFLLPDQQIRRRAKSARAEFSRALVAYLDLVALERNSSLGPRAALEKAAQVGDSWVFRRLAEELLRSDLAGEAAWDGLRDLGQELRLPELGELADIMQLGGGESGAQIYEHLLSRSVAMRKAMLAQEKDEGNAVNQRMVVPMTFLGLLFAVMLITPMLLRLLGRG